MCRFPIFLPTSWVVFPVLCQTEVVRIDTLSCSQLQRKYSPFHQGMMYAMVFYTPWFCWGIIHPEIFENAFYYEMISSFIKCFFCTHWNGHVTFTLYSLGMACHLYCVYSIILSSHGLIPVGYTNDHLIILLDVFVNVHVFLILVFSCSVFLALGSDKG